MPFFIKRYIQFHRAALKIIVIGLIAKLPSGHLFVLVANIYAGLRGKPLRLGWNGKEGNYIVRDHTLSPHAYRIFASGQRHVLSFYGDGLRSVTNDIAHRRMLTQIKFAKGDVVLDCGAHLGVLKFYLDSIATKTRYIGFEPDPINFKCFAHNVMQGRRDGTEVHEIGLWNKTGSMPFYVCTATPDSSFIKPPKYDFITDIPIRKLSEFITGRVKLLKLEAEGGELEVLEGAGDKIRMVEYISADVGAERGIKEEYTLIPVYNYLTAKGFRGVDMWVAPYNSKIIHVLFKNMGSPKK